MTHVRSAAHDACCVPSKINVAMLEASQEPLRTGLIKEKNKHKCLYRRGSRMGGVSHRSTYCSDSTHVLPRHEPRSSLRHSPPPQSPLHERVGACRHNHSYSNSSGLKLVAQCRLPAQIAPARTSGTYPLPCSNPPPSHPLSPVPPNPPTYHFSVKLASRNLQNSFRKGTWTIDKDNFNSTRQT